MITPLRIDFVSDVACPWCAIGLFSLEEALRRTAGVVEAELHFQPFELNPGMAAEGVNHHEYLGRRLGLTAQQLEAAGETVRTRGAAVGFAFNVTPQSRIYNTFDAHRLLHWAQLQGRQRELKRELFKANFSAGLNIADQAVLAGIAAVAGLDESEAREVLISGRHAEDVRRAEELWKSRGIQSVPVIVIEEKWKISGGHPPEIFDQALRSIAAELVSVG
jgi:predicted DsbA family dithiol-disulfide isomerase